MIIQTVYFEGQQYYTVGRSTLAFSNEDGQEVRLDLVALNKVETASPFGISRASWVDAKEAIWIPTQIDFTKTEWFIGVYNGDG